MFHDPEAVQAFLDGFSGAAAGSITIETTPKNINDPEFAARVFGHLARMLDMRTANTVASAG